MNLKNSGLISLEERQRSRNLKLVITNIQIIQIYYRIPNVLMFNHQLNLTATPSITTKSLKKRQNARFTMANPTHCLTNKHFFENLQLFTHLLFTVIPDV